LTTILAVFFSCLVLFASVGYTESRVVKGKRSLIRPDSFIKSEDHFGIRNNKLDKNGRRQFAARAIAESLKQRRRH